MHQTDIMLDIETLGTKPGSVILTIGVCRFSLDEQTVSDKQHLQIHVGTAQKAGLTVDAATVLWWMEQSPEAQQALTSKTAISLSNALTRLSEYVAETRTRNRKNAVNIWANDPDFDIVLTNAAFTATGILEPWKFWESRSMRTIEELGKRLFGFNAKEAMPRSGTYHNAADDAEHQARVVQTIYQNLKMAA